MAELSLQQEIGLAFTAGAIVGGVATYFVVERKLRLKYNQLADDEIQEMKEHYRKAEMNLLDMQKHIAEQHKPDLDAMTKHLRDRAKAEIIAEEAGYVEEETEEDPEEENIFTELPPWNYDKEMAGRNSDFPFIMHLEEYRQSDCSHQITITYFEGDDVLVDEADEVISKKDEVVGMENLTKFGYGSDDPNVVYIRNPKLDIEYEILRHRGHYAKEILGLEEDPSLEHSAIPRRHMKFDDDS